MMWYRQLSTSQFRSFVFKSDSDTKSFLGNLLGQIDKEEIDKQTKRTIEEMFKRRVDHGQTDIDRDTNGQRDNLN